MMKISGLPKDLLEEILSRVPATSYKQLRSTCKLWRRLFTEKRFIKSHLDKSPKQFQALMVKDYKVCSMNINLQGTPPSVEVTSELTTLEKVTICSVSHCDGLLLCTIKSSSYNKIVVWNPCTGQTRWIQPRKLLVHTQYALGSYKDDKHGNSYKILSCNQMDDDNSKQELAICEINSYSWRTLDVTFDDYLLIYLDRGVSLKGNTYFVGSDLFSIYIFSFDYTTEKLGCLPLPCKFDDGTMSLSVVREEKLSALVRPTTYSSKIEIWVTSKIGAETSWNMVFVVDLPHEIMNNWYGLSCLVDDEKKIIVCCNRDFEDDESQYHSMVRIVGEDNRVILFDLGVAGTSSPFLFSYVPSLIQIPSRWLKENNE